ncbi:hypothetical protein [Nocardiopsis coralliicola]
MFGEAPATAYAVQFSGYAAAAVLVLVGLARDRHHRPPKQRSWIRDADAAELSVQERFEIRQAVHEGRPTGDPRLRSFALTLAIERQRQYWPGNPYWAAAGTAFLVAQCAPVPFLTLSSGSALVAGIGIALTIGYLGVLVLIVPMRRRRMEHRSRAVEANRPPAGD